MADVDTLDVATSMTESLYNGNIKPGTPPIETPDGMSSRRDDDVEPEVEAVRRDEP